MVHANFEAEWDVLTFGYRKSTLDNVMAHILTIRESSGDDNVGFRVCFSTYWSLQYSLAIYMFNLDGIVDEIELLVVKKLVVKIVVGGAEG